MNAEQVQGKWKQFRGLIQQNWGKLTRDEIDQINGERLRLIGIIEEKYGKTKEDANQEIIDWLDNI